MVPGKRKEPFGLHFLYDCSPFDVLVTGIGNLPARNLTYYERTIEFHSKPLAKFTVIRQGMPYPRNRRLEFNTLLNAVIHFRQPPGCILARADRTRNLFVARFCSRTHRVCAKTNSTFVPGCLLELSPSQDRK